MQTYKIFLALILLGLCSCGVKGRPLPPQSVAPIGQGAPLDKEGPSKEGLKQKKSNPEKGTQ